jgi:ATP synthase protein I
MFFGLKIDKEYRTVIMDASVVGLHMVSALIVGGVAGHYVDEWLGTKPWFFFGLLILGIAAGFKNVYTDTKKILKAIDSRRDDEKK